MFFPHHSGDFPEPIQSDGSPVERWADNLTNAGVNPKRLRGTHSSRPLILDGVVKDRESSCISLVEVDRPTLHSYNTGFSISCPRCTHGDVIHCGFTWVKEKSFNVKSSFTAIGIHKLCQPLYSSVSASRQRRTHRMYPGIYWEIADENPGLIKLNLPKSGFEAPEN